MQLILLSAGRGSRLSKELRSKPKSLVKVNNIPIIEHNLKFFNMFKKNL
jgi:NDP-sugar pyrophosphorylase family protein